MRKKLLFAWCMLSLLGLVIGMIDTSDFGSFRLEKILYPWVLTSIPLIIHLIYFKIFSEE